MSYITRDYFKFQNQRVKICDPRVVLQEPPTIWYLSFFEWWFGSFMDAWFLDLFRNLQIGLLFHRYSHMAPSVEQRSKKNIWNFLCCFETISHHKSTKDACLVEGLRTTKYDNIGTKYLANSRKLTNIYFYFICPVSSIS